MKLRHVVLLLVLANAAYWGWSHGLLRGIGLGPAVQADPGRLANQIAADAVSVRAYVPPAAAADAAGAAPAAEANRAPAHAGDVHDRPADGGASPAPLPAAGAPSSGPAGSSASPAGSTGNGAPP